MEYISFQINYVELFEMIGREGKKRENKIKRKKIRKNKKEKKIYVVQQNRKREEIFFFCLNKKVIEKVNINLRIISSYR